MANERNIAKRQVNALVENIDFLKLKRLYGIEGETDAGFLARFVHEQVKDVPPTREELKLDRAHKAKAYEKRMADRVRKNGKVA